MELWSKVHVPNIKVWIEPVEFDFGVGGLCFKCFFSSTSCVVWDDHPHDSTQFWSHGWNGHESCPPGMGGNFLRPRALESQNQPVLWLWGSHPGEISETTSRSGLWPSHPKVLCGKWAPSLQSKCIKMWERRSFNVKCSFLMFFSFLFHNTQRDHFCWRTFFGSFWNPGRRAGGAGGSVGAPCAAVVGCLPWWRQLGCHGRDSGAGAFDRDQKLSKSAGQEVSSLASGRESG